MIQIDFLDELVPLAEDDSDHGQCHGKDEAVIVVGVLPDEVHAPRGHTAYGGLRAKFLPQQLLSDPVLYNYLFALPL